MSTSIMGVPYHSYSRAFWYNGWLIQCSSLRMNALHDELWAAYHMPDETLAVVVDALLEDEKKHCNELCHAAMEWWNLQRS